MRRALLLLGLAAALGCGALAAELAWKKYANARFGFVLSYPAGLIASREPTNGAGNEFHSADGEFSLAAQSHFLRKDEGQSLDSKWQEQLRDLGSTVTYKQKGETWFVISGVSEKGFEYYHKFYTKGSNWVALAMTYPHTKNKKYDPWVEQIVKRFIPFRAGDFDRLE